MSKVIPFPALIPAKGHVEDAVCPPYDVIDVAQARAMAEGNPFSLLHVTKPEIDLPEGTGEDDESVYVKGAENLARFKEEGLLVRDEPSLYIYRMESGDHVQTGIVAGVSAEEYGRELIKKHEKTREPKVVNRTRLARALRAHAGPVILVHRRDEALAKLIEEETQEPPIYDVNFEGVRHTLWRARAADEIVKAFGGMEALYIADGHHRSETGFRTYVEMKESDPNHSGDEAYSFFPAVIFPDDEVRVFQYDWDGPPEKRPLADAQMADIMKISDEGGIMPPKSTWFAPKVVSGLFLYTF
jgi:uncharacterized protein (DUF1015 family)